VGRLLQAASTNTRCRVRCLQETGRTRDVFCWTTEAALGRSVGLHCCFNFIGKAVEVLMQPAEHFPLGQVGREISDYRGLSGVFSGAFQERPDSPSRLILLSDSLTVNPKPASAYFKLATTTGNRYWPN
jgi:hypothetical protein